MVVKIGLLGLQGDYAKHSKLLSQLDLQPVLVRYPQQLSDVQGLIIPGGESTTMTKLIKATGFRQPLLEFADEFPILGTCAGLIMMGNQQGDIRVDNLSILDVQVERNAYGRQIESFTGNLVVNYGNREEIIPATFIRAPQITATGSEVEVLAQYRHQPVAVRQGRHIGLTFHPELDDVTLFHQMAFCSNKNE